MMTTTTARLIPTRLLASFSALVVAVSILSTPAVQADLGEFVSVIVREDTGSGSLPEETVRKLGGEVGNHIGLINGFTANVPSGGLDMLRATRGVTAVSPNAPVQLQTDTYKPNTDPGSMYNTINSVKARDLWKKGYTGRGVDVALIDSGVVPVDGLTTTGKVVNGPDLSFEGANPNVQYLDTFGHGTHMAGIIAGRSSDVTAKTLDGNNSDKSSFVGVAPDARIVNVKVAGATGATDVSQVLAAIDWVVKHRYDNEMNIRVLNLSFGTDGTQDYQLDPLTYAAEVAWHHGIVVVVAAGNSQFGNSQLNNPAYDPYVIAVGANDTKGTYSTDDDVVPNWSAQGNGTRNPDLVAPGKSIQSLRAPGSVIDETQGGTGRINDRFFRGTGTSQSAAVVSGAAALLLQQRPSLTPDQVKALLTRSAADLPVADPVAQGSGALDLKSAAKMATPTDATQNHPLATGAGSLEAARGSLHVVSPEFEVCREVPVESEPATSEPAAEETATEESATEEPAATEETTTEPATTDEAATDESAATEQPAATEETATEETATEETATEPATTDEAATDEEPSATEPETTTECHMERRQLDGEQDAHGSNWDGASWSGASWSGASWSGGSWNGASWSGASWSGASWSGASWSGASWSGASWSGASWSGASWSGASWSGASWSGASWSGASWSGASWSGASWSGASWSGASWSGASWSGASWSGASWS